MINHSTDEIQQFFPNRFLQEIFELLRGAGLELTLDQYALLCQAVDRGYGLGGWHDFKRICRLLWVKPSSRYDSNTFDQVFDGYINCQQSISSVLADQIKEITQSLDLPPSDYQSFNQQQRLPQIPTRRVTSQTSNNTGEILTAIKVDGNEFKLQKTKFVLTPQKLPLNQSTVRSQWQALRKPTPERGNYELDLEATVDSILQEGVFSDVILRPVIALRAELLLLIDDANTMLPFRPALQPLIDAIESRYVTPAQIYRFTVFPDDYLYHWQESTKAISVSTVLKQSHQNRTIALIWSDGRSTTHNDSDEYVEKMYRFMHRLAPCVRALVWLNPLPKERWSYSSAQTLFNLLNGSMLHLSQDMWSELTRRNQDQREVQLQPYLSSISYGDN